VAGRAQRDPAEKFGPKGRNEYGWVILDEVQA
jgi:hypothetical protein